MDIVEHLLRAIEVVGRTGQRVKVGHQLLTLATLARNAKPNQVPVLLTTQLVAPQQWVNRFVLAIDQPGVKGAVFTISRDHHLALVLKSHKGIFQVVFQDGIGKIVGGRGAKKPLLIEGQIGQPPVAILLVGDEGIVVKRHHAALGAVCSSPRFAHGGW